MKRIHNFSSFSSLYEAEETAEKPYLKFIQKILSQLQIAYDNQLPLTEDPYDGKIGGDLDSVIAAPGAESWKKILSNVKSAVDSSDKAAKTAGRAWTTSGEKFVSALEKVLDKLKDNKESLDAANKTIKDFAEAKKENLPKAAGNNPVKAAIDDMLKASLDHSDMESYSDLNEGVLKDVLRGKKGRIKELSGRITSLNSTLDTIGEIPGMADTVKNLKNKLKEIEDRLKVLAGKKNREIDDAEITKASDDLTAIPTELAKESKDLDPEILKDYKEAAQDYIDGLKTLEAAQDADQAYAEKAEKEKEKEKDWNQSAKDAIGFKGTVKMVDTKGKKNPVVAEFQKQAINKFKDKIKDSEVFKKFSDGKFAGDGYFGPNTAKVVQGLKAGFGMDDETSDITDDLLDKIFSLKESYSIEESSTFGRIQSFSSFEVINEAKLKFDVNKFLTAVGEKGKEVEKKDLPTPGDLLKSMNKTVEDVYSNNKEGIDYILGKDFQPTEEGRKNFFDIFRIGWKDFSKLNDNQKKNTVAMGFKSVLAPAVGVEKNIGKDLVDIYLKAEKKA